MIKRMEGSGFVVRRRDEEPGTLLRRLTALKVEARLKQERALRSFALHRGRSNGCLGQGFGLPTTSERQAKE